jgi:hypothetical protein
LDFKASQGIDTVHLHFDYYQGSNNGLIHREEARNPLQLLPYSPQAPTLVEVTKQSSTTLRLRVRQAPTSLDIVGFKVERSPSSHVWRTIRRLANRTLSERVRYRLLWFATLRI